MEYVVGVAFVKLTINSRYNAEDWIKDLVMCAVGEKRVTKRKT